MVIPAEVHRFAVEECGKVGWATYLRNLLIRDMAAIIKERSPNSKPPQNHKPSFKDMMERAGSEKGRAVHYERCYDSLLESYERSHPGEDPPTVTPIYAQIITKCPVCERQIKIGEEVVMTTMSKWT